MNPTILDVYSIKEDPSSNLLACRICLACDVKLYHIHDSGLDRMYEETTWTTLSVEDGFPQHICSFCRALLLKSHELRNRSHRAEVILKESLMFQHLITTDYIRTIDRETYRLTHQLSHICSNAGVRIFIHQDEQTDVLNEDEEKLPSLTENRLKNFKDFDLLSDSSDKYESELDAVSDIDEEIEETDENADDIESAGVTKDVSERTKSTPNLKRKRVKKAENAKAKGIIKSSVKNLKEFDLFSDSSDKCESELDTVSDIDEEIGETDDNSDHIEPVGVTKVVKSKPNLKRKRKKLDAVRDIDKEIEKTDINTDDIEAIGVKKAVKSKSNLERKSKKFDAVSGIDKKVEKPENNADVIELVGDPNLRRRVKEAEIAPKARRVFKCRQKPFETKEHFIPFEEKYNFKITKLTDEEVFKEMEARKQLDSYKRALKKCELCVKGFLTENTYNKHMNIHGVARGPYECHFCHSRYGFAAKLRYHINAHILKFQCTVCSIQVTTKYYAELHAGVHAGNKYECKYCDMQFDKGTTRHTHVRLEHPTENADAGACELCGETFVSALGLKLHKTRTHQKQPVPLRNRCKKCKVQFESVKALEKHRSDQPSGKCDTTLRACAQCGATFPSEDEVTQHRASAHGVQIFPCEACSKTFTSRESLTTHSDRVHLKIKPKQTYRPEYKKAASYKKYIYAQRKKANGPVCEQCGKRYPCMAVLKQHMKRHSGQVERPFKCELCPKTYITRHALEQHEAFHTKERKYKCPECPATFMRKASLGPHRVIHRGERAFKCKICDKAFIQSGSLYTHVRYVHMKITPPPRNRKKKTAA